MRKIIAAQTDYDARIAAQLKTLRRDHGLSLDELAAESGVSRATLSRLENGAVSPTAAILGMICAVYGITMSRLMVLAEGDIAAYVPRGVQAEWTDPATGFTRRSVSPPTPPLAGEILSCTIPPGQCLEYEKPPRPGLEHHLYLQKGKLLMTVDGQSYTLRPGDCLRYQLHGASRFETPPDSAATYLLFIV